MKARIIVAAIFVPLLFIIMFFMEDVVFAAVVAIICAIASYELIKSTKESGPGVYAASAVSAALIPFGIWLKLDTNVFMLLLFLLITVLFLMAIFRFKTDNKLTLGEIAIAVFAGFIIPCFLSTLVSMKIMGRLFVLLPFIAAFISDGGAYFTGSYLGKHKVTPHISPNKTVEGCLGGLAAAVVGMLFYGLILYISGIDVNFAIMVLYGFAGSIVTQLGDLAFSMIKREFGIKDYGNILPGHGGMLDRFDSMVFAAPVIYLLVVVLPAF